MTRQLLPLSLLLCLATLVSFGQRANNFTVTAYYSGGPEKVDSLAVDKLTHIIYSFVLLRGNQLHVSPAAGSILRKLVSLKTKHLQLKIQVAFGGWGGCKTCPAVFSTEK